MPRRQSDLPAAVRGEVRHGRRAAGGGRALCWKSIADDQRKAKALTQLLDLLISGGAGDDLPVSEALQQRTAPTMRSAAGSSGEYNSREANTPTARLQGGVGARPHPISDGNEERDATEGACPMMDQVTLNQLRDWPPGKVAAQPIEVLAALADSLAEMKTFVADAEARLNAGLDVRFGDRARQLRAAEARTADGCGSATAISSSSPTCRSGWSGIRHASPRRSRSSAASGRRSRRVRPHRTEVCERRTDRGRWPSAGLFEPARTVETGKPTYRIEPAGKEAA